MSISVNNFCPQSHNLQRYQLIHSLPFTVTHHINFLNFTRHLCPLWIQRLRYQRQWQIIISRIWRLIKQTLFAHTSSSSLPHVEISSHQCSKMSPIFDDLSTECTSIVHPIPIIPLDVRSTVLTTSFVPLFSPRSCTRASYPPMAAKSSTTTDDHSNLYSPRLYC